MDTCECPYCHERTAWQYSDKPTPHRWISSCVRKSLKWFFLICPRRTAPEGRGWYNPATGELSEGYYPPGGHAATAARVAEIEGQR